MNTNTDLHLPDLAQSTLDAPTLDQLFADLAACTRITEIIVKPAPNQMAPPGQVTLEQARALLLSGTIRGIQIRYRYDNADWCDTLLNTPAATRLIRMRGSNEE